MLCAICGSSTKERTESRNVVVIAHKMCIIERMEELGTDSVIACIRDDDIKIYEPMRKQK